MKNKTKILFVTAIAFGFIASVSAVDVSTCSQLDSELSGSTTVNVVSDIDCSGQTLGAHSFSGGTFNGNGYTIGNLTLSSSLLGNSGGDFLFENVVFNNVDANAPAILVDTTGEDLRIERVTVKDSHIEGVTSDGTTGLLTGYVYGEGYVNNIIAENVTVDSTNGESSLTGGGISVSSMNYHEWILDDVTSLGGGKAYLGSATSTDDQIKSWLVVNSTVDGSEPAIVRQTAMDFVIGGNTEVLGGDRISWVAPDYPSSTYLFDVYLDTDTTNLRTDSDGSVGLTTSEMYSSSAETNMPGLDFTNTWFTRENYYPSLLFTLEPQVQTLDHPEPGATFDQGTTQDFNFSVNSGGSSATVDLKITYPNGTTVTEYTDSVASGTTKSYSRQITLPDTGSYSWEVDVGTDSKSQSFEVVDYSDPVYSLNSPVNENIVSYSDTRNIDFSFDINSATISGNYTVELKNSTDSSYTDVKSGTFSSGDNSITDTISVQFPASGTQNKDWRVTVEDEISTSTSSASTFTAERLPEPEVAITRPNQGEVFWVEQGGTVEVPFEGYVADSPESGTAYAFTFKDYTGTINDVEYREKLGAISPDSNQTFSGQVTVGTTGTHINSRIEAELPRGNTFCSAKCGVGGRNFEVKVANPEITSYTVEPDFTAIEPGESFNITIEGNIKKNPIDRIEYDLDVGQNDVASVTSDPIDFQDQNSFTDSLQNVFEMKESYQGEELTVTATVIDTEGFSNTASEDGRTTTPPDHFVQNSPDPNQVFLIPEGDSETEVDIDYGVDTAENPGTAKLFVQGSQVDSFSVSADTTKTATYSANYTESNYEWKVRFTDSDTGITYNSSRRTFDVTDEPISLTLNSPSNDTEFNLLDRDSITVEHKYNVDSRALAGNYYNRFVLENTDTNTVLRNRTSADFESGVRDFNQKISGLSNASYSWDVKVFQSSDDTLLESKSSSYTIVKEPLFDIFINSPVDGSVYQVAPGNTTDVTVRYGVETFAEATDFTLTRNGTTVATHSVPQATSDSFTTTLNDLSPDQYDIKLKGEDAEGNTNSTSISFTVNAVEEDDEEDEVPEVYEAEFRPPISEARVGDELDLYIEGSQFPKDVDFVDVKVETGAGTKTFTVPGDQLNRQNSFNYTIEDALTVTSAMLGNPVAIYGSLQSVAGEVSSYFFDKGDAGESTTIGAVPNYPASNVSIKQPPGVSEDVRFDFNVNSLAEEVDYTVLATGENDSTPGTYSPIAGSEINEDLEPIPANSNENVVLYRNMGTELFINQSRGQFRWKVKVFTGDGSESDSSVEYSQTAEFNIVDSDKTTLNFLNPSDNSELETPEGSNQRDVKFDFSVDTAESGRLYLELYDDTVDANADLIYDRQVGSGKTPDSETETLETGSYRAVLNFESENFDIEKSRDFSIVKPEDATQCESPTVALKRPTYDILYSDSSYIFEWSVCNPNEYDSASNTTLYIEDDEGNVQESVFEEYETQGEVLSFSPRIETNFPQGDYRTYANFTYPNTTIQSDVKDFQIVDFTKPESFDLSPDARSFKSDEDIPISWTTQAYEENVEVRAKIKRVGDYQANTVKVDSLSANSQESFSDTITRSPGEYEFYVDMIVSPEGSASPMTFSSNRTTFEVTSANLPKANFTLIEPEQGAEYDIPNSSQNATVPFAFDVEVAGTKNWKIDLLVQDVDEETGFIRKNRFTLPGSAGTGSFNKSLELNESGYRYKLRAVDPNGEETVSTTRSFVVDNPETAEVPELPNPDPDEGFFEKSVNGLSGAIAGFVAIVGTAGLFFVATALTVVTGMVIHLLTESDGLSLLSMLATVVFFVGIGWYPGWVGMILFLGSAGIFMFGVRKVTTGGE